MRIKDIFITIGSAIRRKEKRELIRLSCNFRSQKGLEIGGPSSSFSLYGHFPVYLFAKQIDGVNYSNKTVWEGTIKEGNTYKYHNKTGHQYIKEAADLSGIASNSFDFVLSCHSLEHVANPLKALKEWRRVLKENGHLILVLPNRDFSYDIKRPYTSMQHLITDFEKNVTEEDTTHFEEVIATIDDNDPIRESAIKLIRNNYEQRCVHHHVFDFKLITEMLEWVGFTVKKQSTAKVHLFTLAQKK
jgi:ubiquinone/menaquinone biosynthesis C-methylase UbiE